MADSADVRSIEAIQEMRKALCAFEEEAKNALMDVDFDIRRAREWLSNEQRLYWIAEIRRWEQNLAMAKSELARKKLGRFLDHKPDTSQEEKKVRFAQNRLEECQRKQEITKRWATAFLRDMQEYHSQAQPLMDMLEGDLARGLSRLDRMLDAIEAYTQVAPPTLPSPSAGSPRSVEAVARPVPSISDPSSPSGAASTSDATPSDAEVESPPP